MHTPIQTIEELVLVEDSEERMRICDALNSLIAKILNSRNMFANCAEASNHNSLSDLCLEWKRRRDQLALDLQKMVSRLGGIPATDENFAGWINRLWTKGRLVIESGTDDAITDELRVEEEGMRHAFEETLATPGLPHEARQVILHEQTVAAKFASFFQALDDPMELQEPVVLPED